MHRVTPESGRWRLIAFTLAAVAVVTTACSSQPAAPARPQDAATTPAPAPSSAPSAAQPTPFVYAPPVLGRPEAPVTLVEFGDFN